MKQKNEELEIVLKDFKNGTISVRQAVNQIGSFVVNNYPVFGLQKYDEDSRQEILLAILEHGEYLILNYHPEIGDFFTFLYCYIRTLKNSVRRHNAVNTLCDNVITEELSNTIDEKIYKYRKINYSLLDTPKAPYAYKPIPAEELKKAMHEIAAENQSKKLLVLALKSAYYLDDTQIEKISKYCNIKKEFIYESVQICKNSIQRKVERRGELLERRDSAYYRHKRYKKLMDHLNRTETQNKDLIAKINRKVHRFNDRWDRINNFFGKGQMSLRTTSKTVSNLLGICERQVNYYINCAKKEYEHKNTVNPKKE